MLNQIFQAAQRHNFFAVLKCVPAVIGLLGPMATHAQQQSRAAVPPIIAQSDALLAFASEFQSPMESDGAAVAFAAAAEGQPDLPIAISPLRIEPDPNNVNLVNGKTEMGLPVLAVPGAPNLRFDRVQNSAPHINGKLSGSISTTLQSSYSVHRIDGSSDSFTCVDYDCNDVTGSGSVLVEGSINARRYRRGNSGELYDFNLKHVKTTGSSRVTMYYASSVEFQNGEVLTYTYDTVVSTSVGITRTYYRPTRVSSNLGFFITISYHSAVFGEGGWGAPASAAIYNDADPVTPIKRLNYSPNGDTITEVTPLGDRTYTCSNCRNSLGSGIETTVGTETRPGESVAARSVTTLPTDSLVGSVTNDGVTWNYSYVNVHYDLTMNDLLYDRVTVTGPNGYSVAYDMKVSYSHDRNVMTKITDSLGRETVVGFDDLFRPDRMVTPEGIETTVAYNYLGNITAKTTTPKPGSGLAAVSETLDFKVAGCDGVVFDIMCYRPNWHRDALGRQTDFLYNTKGQLTERTDPADADGVRKKTYITYVTSNGISRPTVIRVCGDTTTCGTATEIRTEYDYWGKTLLPSVVRRIDAERGETLVTTNTYDLAGRLLSSDGPIYGSGDATYHRYDEFGRKQWEIGPADSAGIRQAKWTDYRDSDDKVKEVVTGYVTSVDTPVLVALNRTVTSYDNHRNPELEVVSSAGSTLTLTQRTYDDRGRLECEARRMNPNAFSALPANACTLGQAGIFGDDRITRNVYDNASQLRQVQRAVGTSIEQVYATYTYTPDGKQETVKDANGNLTTYQYDGFDRMSKMRFPVATSGAGSSSTTDYEQYGYDSVGNRLTLRKRDGKVIGYSYDGLNRVRSKTVPVSTDGVAGYSVWYGYDERGLQTFARFGSVNGTGVTNLFDGFGRPWIATTNMDGVARKVEWTYITTEGRRQIKHPDGPMFEYAHEPNGNLAVLSENGATPLTVTIYDDFARREEIQRDQAGWKSIFNLDPISRLESIGHNLDGAATTNDVGIGFSYNPASQVTARSQTNNVFDYQIASVSQGYTTNGRNQYTQIAGTNGGTLTSDANGNLTSDGFTTFKYDTENRLTSASGAKTATLIYDPLGRLYQVSNASGTTRFLHDGDRLIAEYDASGALQRRYVHGNGVDEPVVQYEGDSVSSATRRYLIADHQGSIIATTDAAGTTQQIGVYDAYGVTTAANTGRFQYTGQTAIPQVGLYYYKARFYNPSLGRFMQTDPIGYDDDLNLYAYVGNDPLNATDPSGTIAMNSMCSRVGATSCAGSYAAPEGRSGAGKDTPKTGGATQVALDVVAASETPVASQVAGIVSGLISLANGDWTGATLSAVGLTPVFGDAADVTKITRTTKALLGQNARAAGNRTATDLAGNVATAKSIFRNQARGQEITQTTMKNGGIRRAAPDGTQIRMNPNGTTRLDLPNRGPLPQGETLHIPPET